MAWIAVHEQLDGAKLRQLKKAIGCSKMEAIGILVTLWLWSINNANRNGELYSADCEDVAEVFALSLSPKITPKAVVAALIKTGWLDLVDDRLFVHDWPDWQDQWFRALDAREKDRARKRAAVLRQQGAVPSHLEAVGISVEFPKEDQQNFRGISAENPVQPSPSPLPSPNREGKADKPPRASRFTPPTVEDVAAYCQERKNSVDAARFVDFYASKGWKVGKNAMKDWRAAVRTWERRESGGVPQSFTDEPSKEAFGTWT